MPAPSIALNASIDSLLDLVHGLLRQVRGDDRLRSFVEVLRLVVVELARRDDLAGHRRLGRVVAEDRALDLARVGHRGLDDDLPVEAAGERHRRRAARRRPSPSRCRRSIPGWPASRTSGTSAPSRGPAAILSAIARPSRGAARPGTGTRAARARRRAPSSPPCPCRPPTPARRRRRRGCWRARAVPGSCRPRRTGRAASGR